MIHLHTPRLPYQASKLTLLIIVHSLAILMATAANRAALQTALLSVRGLRRRRLGHIGPNHYPQNELDKWGRKKNGLKNGMPSNLLGLGGSSNGGGFGRRPAPRASLVLGGQKPISRRKQNGLNGHNGAGSENLNGNNGRLSNPMEQQQQQQLSPLGSRSYVNGNANGLSSSHAKNGIASNNGHQQMRKIISSTNPEEQKQQENNASSSPKSQNGYSSDLVVVLDMDECLIHSQFLSDHLVDKYRQVEDRPNSFHKGSSREEAIMWSTCESFRINLPDGDLVKVNKRPNLDLFLKEITSKFETYIFTAAMEVYASPVLNKIDPTGTMFAGRFYREHCQYDSDLGVYAKDLCYVMRSRKMMINAAASRGDSSCINGDHHGFACDERRVVLVDNNPLSFLPNPSNGILVSSFYDDPKDDTLEAVMELLHELDDSEDVRPILESKFGLKDALDDVVKGAAMGW